MGALKLTTERHALRELTSSPGAVLGATRSAGRALILTEDGESDLVVMSAETFHTLRVAWQRVDLQAGLDEAERQVRSGEVLEHDEIVALLDGLAADRP